MNRPVLLILCLLSASGCGVRRELPLLDQGWSYATTPAGAKPAANAWKEEVRRDGVQDLWMRVPLPQQTAPASIVFRTFAGELAMFVDDVPLYSFRDEASDGRLTLHVVPLPANSGGHVLTFRVPHAPDRAVFGTAPYVVERGATPLALTNAATAPLHSELADILLGIVLCVIGVIAIGASAILARGDVLPIRYFGAFTLLYGARLLVASYLPVLMGGSLQTARYAEAIITYVIPVAAWALAVRLLGPGRWSSLRWQVVLFAIVAPIGIASDLITRRPFSMESLNNVLVIAGGVNILANLLTSPMRRTLELRIVLAGAALFLLFALNNNLVSLGLVPWEFHAEAPGFVVFVAALGFAAARGFVRGERQRVAIDNELQTAREIQQSILPTTMPQVRGLSVHAQYAPATAVAGDVFDFLRADEQHVGVLVADVAGHGVPAALIAAMVKVAGSSQERLAHDGASFMHELNVTLRREVRRAFVTATYLWLDMERRTVSVCNAGHPAPLLLRDGTFEELGAQGVLLGRFAGARYETRTRELRPGDRIIAFTDGITEARNELDEQFGEERLQSVIRGAAIEEADTAADRVLAAVRAWREGATEDDADDVTIVVIDVGRVE